MIKQVAVLVLSTVFMSGTVSAGDEAVTFFLKATGHNTPKVEFKEDDVTLTVRAGSFNSRTFEVTSPNKGVDLTLNGWYGLGVDNDSSGNWRQDRNHALDGHKGNDLIALSLSEEMRIKSIKFSFWDSNDDFHFWSDQGKGLELEFEDQGVRGRGYVTYTFKDDYISDYFAIGADGKHDDFKVKKVTFAHVAAVPEPATWLMMLMGFSCTAFAMRRRSQAGIATA